MRQQVTFAVLVEEGDDSGLSDAAAVADSDLLDTEALAGFDFADDDVVRKVAYANPQGRSDRTVTPNRRTVGFKQPEAPHGHTNSASQPVANLCAT